MLELLLEWNGKKKKAVLKTLTERGNVFFAPGDRNPRSHSGCPKGNLGGQVL